MKRRRHLGRKGMEEVRERGTLKDKWKEREIKPFRVKGLCADHFVFAIIKEWEKSCEFSG